MLYFLIWDNLPAREQGPGAISPQSARSQAALGPLLTHFLQLAVLMDRQDLSRPVSFTMFMLASSKGHFGKVLSLVRLWLFLMTTHWHVLNETQIYPQTQKYIGIVPHCRHRWPNMQTRCNSIVQPHNFDTFYRNLSRIIKGHSTPMTC